MLVVFLLMETDKKERERERERERDWFFGF